MTNKHRVAAVLEERSVVLVLAVERKVARVIDLVVLRRESKKIKLMREIFQEAKEGTSRPDHQSAGVAFLGMTRALADKAATRTTSDFEKNIF